MKRISLIISLIFIIAFAKESFRGKPVGNSV